MQETCLAASRGQDGLRDPEAFQPWLMGIARNKYADYCRKKKKNPETLRDAFPQEAVSGGEPFPDDDETLSRLREKDRIMLTLFYLERMPLRQIARALRIPEGTVKSRLHTARAHFRQAYIEHENKGANEMKHLPAALPPYTITWKNEAPFPVKWEELTGWFAVPKIGEEVRWGIYELPSRQLDVAYDMRVTGPARVHGLDGVEITARLLSAREAEEDDPMSEPIVSSGAREGDWRFVAQIRDDHTRFLAAERREGENKILSTFLDPDFLDNWGCGENNQGNPIFIAPRGLIRRQGGAVICRDEGKEIVDMVGRCELILDGEKYDAVCVMDVNANVEGVLSEQYLDENGRTILWRRFNPNEWRREKYGKTWAETLPENEQITVNGRLYVHWYDCLCAR